MQLEVVVFWGGAGFLEQFQSNTIIGNLNSYTHYYFPQSNKVCCAKIKIYDRLCKDHLSS